ncbi:MAG: phosphogluconate dehydrogenase (NAD(+)-dependent, decarboxylating) [Candidatus Saccharimonadia bacterium]
MKIGLVGLGRMGTGISERLLKNGHEVVVFNRHAEKAAPLVALGAEHALRYSDFANLPKPRIVWVMVPAGEATEEVIFGPEGLVHTLEAGDIIIDGGNSHYTDTVAHSKKLTEEFGIHLLDCGTSGGLVGRERGYCVMVGGDEEAYKIFRPALDVIAQPGGYGYFGKSGAGHYVKMVHNGIEYGMMQSIAEGLALIKNGQYMGVELPKLIEVWQHGSIIESFLVGLGKTIFEANPNLDGISGYIAENGEGRWTVDAAKEVNLEMPSIQLALDIRASSRDGKVSDTTRIVAALRQQFGGHSIEKPQ